MTAAGTSSSLKFAAADVVVKLGFPDEASAVQIAFPCYIELMMKDSDNNVRLIILERISSLLKDNASSLQGQLLDMHKIFSR